jgi:hypothetical protein
VSGGWSFDLRRLRLDEHDRFVDSLTSGKDNMPSWYGILKNEEIEAIWAYIRATVDNKHETASPFRKTGARQTFATLACFATAGAASLSADQRRKGPRCAASLRRGIGPL